MLYITKIYFPVIFSECSCVGFDLSDGSHYEGEITKHQGFYLSIKKENNNNIIFRKLGISNQYEFVRSRVIGTVYHGGWPEVSTLSDLRTVISALGRYNRIPEDKKYIINDDKEREPFTLSIKSKKSLSLNYKL